MIPRLWIQQIVLLCLLYLFVAKQKSKKANQLSDQVLWIEVEERSVKIIEILII